MAYGGYSPPRGGRRSPSPGDSRRRHRDYSPPRSGGGGGRDNYHRRRSPPPSSSSHHHQYGGAEREVRNSRGDEGFSLFISNVPYDADAGEFRDIFSKYGAVKDVYIPVDYHTRKPRGMCYVEFHPDTRDMHGIVAECDGIKYLGKSLEIKIANRGRKDPNSMRHQTNGRGGDRADGRYGSRRDDYSRSRGYEDSRRGGPRRQRSLSRSPPRQRSRSRSGSRQNNQNNSPNPAPVSDWD